MKRCLKALALLIGVVGSSGWATEKRVLVSTWFVTDTLYVSFSTGQYYNGEEHDLAQKFTTGSQTGYRLTNVAHGHGNGCSNSNRHTYKMSLRADNSGEPGNKLSDITKGGAVGDDGVLLSANTNYWILFDYQGGGDCGVFDADNQNSEDSDGLSGWAMDDGHNRDENDDGSAFPDTVTANSWQEEPANECSWCQKQYTIRLRLTGYRDICPTGEHRHDNRSCHATSTVHCPAGQHKHDGLSCHNKVRLHCPAGQHAHDGRSCHVESEDHTPTPVDCPAGQHDHDDRGCHSTSVDHNPTRVSPPSGGGSGGGRRRPRPPNPPEEPEVVNPPPIYTLHYDTIVPAHGDPKYHTDAGRPTKMGQYKLIDAVGLDGEPKFEERFQIGRIKRYVDRLVFNQFDVCGNSVVPFCEDLAGMEERQEIRLRWPRRLGEARSARFEVLEAKLSEDMYRCVIDMDFVGSNIDTNTVVLPVLEKEPVQFEFDLEAADTWPVCEP